MWVYNNSHELYHHGILGMKWGVRRTKEQLARARGRSKTDDWSGDAKEASALKKKSVKQLSNAEIRKLNERTSLENRYNELNPSAFKKGVKFVAAAASIMGTAMSVYNNSNTAIKIGKTASSKIIDTVGNMVMKDLSKRING